MKSVFGSLIIASSGVLLDVLDIYSRERPLLVTGLFAIITVRLNYLGKCFYHKMPTGIVAKICITIYDWYTFAHYICSLQFSIYTLFLLFCSFYFL